MRYVKGVAVIIVMALLTVACSGGSGGGGTSGSNPIVGSSGTYCLVGMNADAPLELIIGDTQVQMSYGGQVSMTATHQLINGSYHFSGNLFVPGMPAPGYPVATGSTGVTVASDGLSLVFDWLEGQESQFIYGESGACTTTPYNMNSDLPQFVGQTHVNISELNEISMFRSGYSHAYDDSVERCRSLKHYYSRGPGHTNLVNFYAPVDVRIVMWEDNLIGNQFMLQPTDPDYKAFTFKVFHVELDSSLSVGDVVAAGDIIGTDAISHGEATSTDFAVYVYTTVGGQDTQKLISIFDLYTADVMTTDFSGFQRSDFIFSASYRDANPFSCSGESFNHNAFSSLDPHGDANFVSL